MFIGAIMAETGDILAVDNVALKTLKKIGSNATGEYYLLGDESTDGSVRFKVIGAVTHIQARTAGVWDNSSFMSG